jgi:hypothetical protein
MHIRVAVSVFALTALPAVGGAAQTPPMYYCDPLQAAYPAVPTCPVPWRTVSPAPTSSPATGPQSSVAQLPPAGFAALGDGLDEFCKSVTLPRTIALCSDPELRTLAVERQHAFDEAKARLNPDQQKVLLADQKQWTGSYSQACGLSQEAPPILPLAREVQRCMMEAGRARVGYLKAYGGTSTVSTETDVASGKTTSAPAEAGAQYRCHDPNTNFDYERLEPCAAGDVMLSGPPPIPNQNRPVASVTEDRVTSKGAPAPEATRPGYKQISVHDFLLDGRQMANDSSKVALRGYYVRVGDSAYLFQSSGDAVMAHQVTFDYSSAVPLLTEDADRGTREYLLGCKDYFGCPFHLTGHVTMCAKTSLLGSKDLPCVDVEGG